MLNNGLEEKDLPKEKENMIINREFILNLIKKGLEKKSNINSLDNNDIKSKISIKIKTLILILKRTFNN
jgi:hypothetical protein